MILTGQKSVLTVLLGFDPQEFIAADTNIFGDANLYHSFQIKPKNKNRKPRQILAPCRGLKTVQRSILGRILVQVPPHPAATAFFPGRSVVLNARPHLGCRHLYKTDVSDFFSSIKSDHIRRMLHSFLPHLSHSAIDELVSLTTHNGSLPQGAPTSPHLANLALFNFDASIARLCHDVRARYTRYADDITVSAWNEDTLMIVADVIRSGLADLGLTQHSAKTRFAGPNTRKIVSGLDVSGTTIRPPRSYRKKATALVRMCEAYPKRMERHSSRVMGYLSYWQGIAPDDPELHELKLRMRHLQREEIPRIGRAGIGDDFEISF